MEPVKNKVVSGESAASGRLAETIAQHTETMSAVERLCLQSGGTLVALGRSDYKGIVKIEWTDLHKHEAFDYLYVPRQMQGGPWSDYGFEKNFKHGVLLKRFVKGSQ